MIHAIIVASICLYLTGFYFAALVNREDKGDSEHLFMFAIFGIVPLLVAIWISRRPSKLDRLERQTKELEKRAILIERMAKAVKSIPAEQWQVVRAEHLEAIVEKLSKRAQ